MYNCIRLVLTLCFSSVPARWGQRGWDPVYKQLPGKGGQGGVEKGEAEEKTGEGTV